MKILLCVPTYNAAKFLPDFITNYRQQSLQATKVLVIDSSSQDNTQKLVLEAGFDLITIPKEEFNHGLTRNLALNYAQDCELIAFMTQDAIFADTDALLNLTASFKENSQIAIAYGRQLATENANPIAKFARIYNYGEENQLKTLKDKEKLGIKTIFCSNSFACYRKTDLIELGGFPATNFGEDALFAAKCLLAGRAIFYNADAKVWHSHNLNLRQTFKRYQEIGKFHTEHNDILKDFLAVNKAGASFVLEELKYLAKYSPFTIPKAIFHTGAKYLGYKLGKRKV